MRVHQRTRIIISELEANKQSGSIIDPDATATDAETYVSIICHDHCILMCAERGNSRYTSNAFQETNGLILLWPDSLETESYEKEQNCSRAHSHLVLCNKCYYGALSVDWRLERKSNTVFRSTKPVLERPATVIMSTNPNWNRTTDLQQPPCREVACGVYFAYKNSKAKCIILDTHVTQVYCSITGGLLFRLIRISSLNS